jgi:hypothetical protein
LPCFLLILPSHLGAPAITRHERAFELKSKHMRLRVRALPRVSLRFIIFISLGVLIASLTIYSTALSLLTALVLPWRSAAPLTG